MLAVAFMSLVSFIVGQDYMKMMKPYEESPQDLVVAKQMAAVDAAMGQGKSDVAATELEKLRAMKPKKNLEALLKSKDPNRRALAVLGLRLLPVKRMWEDLRFMLMDSAPQVRWQVLLYAGEFPQGIEVESVQMSLSDSEPLVRVAAIGAVIKTARKKEAAAELLRMRYQDEKDPQVLQKVKLGFTILGLPPPPPKQ